MIKEKVITNVCEVCLMADGMLYMNFFDDQTVELQDRIELIEVCTRLSEGKKLPVLIHAGKRNKISPDARKYDMNAQTEKFVLKEAIIISNLATRISATFYYKLRKPNFEVRMFATHDEAVEWLNQSSDSISMTS